MNEIWIPLLQLIASLVVLWKICDTMVEGLSSLSIRFKIPQSVAGATLAAIGSSAPEFGTSTFAILITEGGKYPDIGLATILGSAIFNVFVIIGLSAIFRNLKVLPRVYTRDLVVYFITTILLAYALHDGKIDFQEALIALFMYGMYALVLIRDIKAHPEHQDEVKQQLPTWLACLYFLGGIAIVSVACHFLVEATINLANATSVPNALISVLILAVGTSIPDCFASIAAARRGHGAMAISNALGSNVFDILVCLGVPLLILNSQGQSYHIASGHTEKFILIFSILFLVATLAITLILLRHKWSVGKGKAIVFIGIYVIYIVIIIAAYILRDAAYIRNFPSWFGF